jgi:FixJ family two-component response regulator
MVNMPPPRKTIAIVDDDFSVRQAIDRQLRAAGYRCESFASAEDFVAIAASVGAACLLTDIHLGGMTGIDLALHPTVTGLNLPVVLISGSIDPSVEVAARQIGVAFLRKPICGAVLLETIIDTVGAPIADGDL